MGSGEEDLADEAEVHLKLSTKLHSEVEKPLMNFHENVKKDKRKCDHHIADLCKQLASCYALVEKARKALTEWQRDLEMKTQQLEINLSNKMEEDIKKARRNPHRLMMTSCVVWTSTIRPSPSGLKRW
ncbi:Growth arrest-specific protein 7 [Sciurus carolinensis]|uniref:Growth arrest-specific protein 7 n=1 Tax=Sciurus carolinensis TaxID=30640 RepID=A0AA41TAJ8_SCICA|nr:Growth arrest-specific protein 7 [Sciurus carolinensis]